MTSYTEGDFVTISTDPTVYRVSYVSKEERYYGLRPISGGWLIKHPFEEEQQLKRFINENI